MADEAAERSLDMQTLMAELRRSMADVKGIDEFLGAGAAFINGEEQDIDLTVERMMSFFNGEIGGYSEERQRLVVLAPTLRRPNDDRPAHPSPNRRRSARRMHE